MSGLFGTIALNDPCFDVIAVAQGLARAQGPSFLASMPGLWELRTLGFREGELDS